MRDLSLHVLDLLENAVRAGASTVRVTLAVDVSADRLELAVEDNGPGLTVAEDVATDPFYTTKAGKRVGLGLSLFRASAEAAGGWLAVEPSDLGGACVRAVMAYAHIDRLPLGNLAASLHAIAVTNPGVDFWCRLRLGTEERIFGTPDASGAPELLRARRFREGIESALADLE